MSIASYSIPVPAFGTGDSVNVGDLVDSTTAVLTGSLVGAYVLCVGHEPDALVPLSRLNDDGQPEITALASLAYQYAAVRVVGNAQPSVGVSVVLSGLSRVGENKFGSLAVLSPGDFGSQAAVDTYTLFPPTGLETEINIICKGSFEGPILVEGSTNGISWNPVASFQAGLTNASSPPIQVLEYVPFKITDKVRYFRVSVTGRILGPTRVTLGGRIPVSGGGGGSPTGPAGGELTGTYPNPNLSTVAVQTKALAVCDPAGAAAGVQGNLNTHAGLTTSAHGGLIPSSAAGAAGGVATLGLDGKVPLSELPPLGGAPSGPAGGELTGTYPNPNLDTTAVQTKALAVCDPAGAAAVVQGNLNTHAGLTTTAHGGLIPSSAAGAAGGVATLGPDGIVPDSQLPPISGIVLSAKGDLITRTSTVPTVLPVGTEGQKLVVRAASPTGLAWETDTPIGGLDGSIFSMIGPTGAPNAIAAWNFTKFDRSKTLAQNVAAANLSGNPLLNMVVAGVPVYSTPLDQVGFLPPYSGSVEGGSLSMNPVVGDYVKTATGSNNILRLVSEVTMELFLAVYGISASGTVPLGTMTGIGETSDANILYAINLVISSPNCTLEYVAEHGAGVNITASTVNLSPNAIQAAYQHIVLVRDVTGKIILYCNGRRLTALTTPVDAGGGGIILPDYGPSPNQEFYLGIVGFGAGQLKWLGAKITAATFSDAQVRESFNKTMFGQ